METRVTEVAEGIHQLSTYIPEANFGFNQYLITGDEPLLFHTGMRGVFPLVSGAASRVLPLDSLRWITFGHLEADECGAMNEWLGAAPYATVAQSQTGCMVSIGDLADRSPRALADGEVLDIGGHRLRWIDTPHVPHGWEAGVLFDETTGTLLCGDLFTRYGDFAATTADDIVAPAIESDRSDDYGSWALSPNTGPTLRKLADLPIETLAPMHGSAFTGDGPEALRALASVVEDRINRT